MSKPGHVLILCTANICRSPMAEGLLRHALQGQPEPLKSLKVISAGVATRSGEKVSENSVIALKKTGIDISGNRSQQVSQEMLDHAVAVLCMTESHRAMVQMKARPVPKHLYLFREFLPASCDHEIGDPFGGPVKLYEACRDEMVEAIPSILDFLRKTVK